MEASRIVLADLNRGPSVEISFHILKVLGRVRGESLLPVVGGESSSIAC